MEDNTKTNTSTTKTPVKKKGNAQSEMVIGAAANLIKKANDDLKKAVDMVNNLGVAAENHQALIAQKEDRIKELDVEFAEKKRAATVALDLEVKANESKVVEEVLAKNSQVAIDTKELNEIRERATKNESDLKSAINTAVHAATGAMKKDHDNAMLLKDAEFKAAQAENQAKINNLESQVKMLNDQCGAWQKALEQERAAGVERSKAASIGTLNVGQPTK